MDGSTRQKVSLLVLVTCAAALRIDASKAPTGSWDRAAFLSGFAEVLCLHLHGRRASLEQLNASQLLADLLADLSAFRTLGWTAIHLWPQALRLDAARDESERTFDSIGRLEELAAYTEGLFHRSTAARPPVHRSADERCKRALTSVQPPRLPGQDSQKEGVMNRVYSTIA